MSASVPTPKMTSATMASTKLKPRSRGDEHRNLLTVLTPYIVLHMRATYCGSADTARFVPAET